MAKRSSNILGVAVIATVVAGLFAAPIYAVLRDRIQGDSSSSMGDIGGTPVELDTLRPAVARLYRGASDHARHFEQIPCFCGCQEGRLEHRHLLDCYVLRDGGGWESHAIGCDVCKGEARLALSLLSSGTPVDEVRARIVETFGMPDQMKNLQEG